MSRGVWQLLQLLGLVMLGVVLHDPLLIALALVTAAVVVHRERRARRLAPLLSRMGEARGAYVAGDLAAMARALAAVPASSERVVEAPRQLLVARLAYLRGDLAAVRAASSAAIEALRKASASVERSAMRATAWSLGAMADATDPEKIVFWRASVVQLDMEPYPGAEAVARSRLSTRLVWRASPGEAPGTPFPEPLLDSLSPLERELARALQRHGRSLAAGTDGVYRRGERDDGPRPDLSPGEDAWFRSVAPEVVPFVRRPRRIETTPSAAASGATSPAEAPPTHRWKLEWIIGGAMLLVPFVVLGHAVLPYLLKVEGLTTWAGGTVLALVLLHRWWKARAVAADAAELSTAYLAEARGDGEPGARQTLERIAASPRSPYARSALVGLLGLEMRSGDFERARVRCDHPLMGAARRRLAARTALDRDDTALLAARLQVLALAGRLDEVRPEGALLDAATPHDRVRQTWSTRLELLVAVKAGNLARAAELAASQPSLMSLPLREELLGEAARVVAGTGGLAGDADSLRRDLEELPLAAAWVKKVAPELLEQALSARS